MGLLDGVLGAAKLASNFFGGGSGTKTNTSQSSSQNSSQTQTQNSSGTTSASRREFSDGFLRQLELATAEALKTSNQNTDTLQKQLGKVQGATLGPGYTVDLSFNPDTFVNSIVGSARDAIQRGTTQNVNKIAANTGGSASGNSAAALLASRVANEGATNLAGIEGQARGQAAEISRANEALRLEGKVQGNQQNLALLESQTQQMTGIASTVDASLTALLNALKGGETAQDVTNNENTTIQSNGTTTGSVQGTTKQPFNWTAGLGNLFKDIGQA